MVCGTAASEPIGVTGDEDQPEELHRDGDCAERASEVLLYVPRQTSGIEPGCQGELGADPKGFSLKLVRFYLKLPQLPPVWGTWGIYLRSYNCLNYEPKKLNITYILKLD